MSPSTRPAGAGGREQRKSLGGYESGKGTLFIICGDHDVGSSTEGSSRTDLHQRWWRLEGLVGKGRKDHELVSRTTFTE